LRLPPRPDYAPRQEWTEADVLGLIATVTSGYRGRASWMPFCVCGHVQGEHALEDDKCQRCACSLFRPGKHECLDIWLDPDAVPFLPEGIVVQAYGQKYDRLGLLQFRLMRDIDSSVVQVMRSGIKTTTIVYTSPPEGAES